MKPTAGISIHLPTPACLMDHHFQGRPVLPAVEAMEALARIAKETRPDLSIHSIADIRFDKFLYLDPHKHRLDAVADLQPSQDNGSLQACLTTRNRAPKSAITRTKVHARLSFSQFNAAPEAWPMDVAAALEGACIQVPPEKLYEELVPFGPAFRNIVAPVWISPDGALTCIRTPDYPRETWLGSPFTLMPLCMPPAPGDSTTRDSSLSRWPWSADPSFGPPCRARFTTAVFGPAGSWMTCWWSISS